MKGWNLSFLREERGFAVLAAFLIIAPLLLLAMEGLSGMGTAVFSADVDVQEAAAFAAKAAAMQVTSKSQADGKPRIDTSRAHAAFRDALARNMGLDPATLAPLSSSAYSSVKYWLVTYNGYDDYASEGAYGARYFQFNGTAATESSFPYSGFPAKFAVTTSGILWGAGGVRTVTLESPGVVVLVDATAKRVFGQGTVRSQRWAAARIVCKEGTCSVQ
ncbi:hypothetical protein SAMN02745218_01181 [Desulfofundulus australicus DSM 11792]|uniref:Flp pilus-assembly TadE/G-like n=1 Tax=Desulfofundulus australicus DSM 11792 TaxID=1121425 RepID=A0A1M4XV04_9FIRM|nr:hypothetical protein [Desulfofundulus australicus]SHE97319.1 hypothetical protein SAMN02745218_01181 [Desulfofundulus australicus DSM 11792]